MFAPTKSPRASSSPEDWNGGALLWVLYHKPSQRLLPASAHGVFRAFPKEILFSCIGVVAREPH